MKKSRLKSGIFVGALVSLFIAGTSYAGGNCSSHSGPLSGNTTAKGSVSGTNSSTGSTTTIKTK